MNKDKLQTMKVLRQLASQGRLDAIEITELVKIAIASLETKNYQVRQQLMDTETALVAATESPKAKYGDMSAKEFMASKLSKWRGKTYFNWDLTPKDGEGNE